jgi:hypothetical protein
VQSPSWALVEERRWNERSRPRQRSYRASSGRVQEADTGWAPCTRAAPIIGLVDACIAPRPRRSASASASATARGRPNSNSAIAQSRNGCARRHGDLVVRTGLLPAPACHPTRPAAAPRHAGRETDGGESGAPDGRLAAAHRARTLFPCPIGRLAPVLMVHRGGPRGACAIV